MIVELIIKAVEAAAEKSKARERQVLAELRRQNDAAAQFDGSRQQQADRARAAAARGGRSGRTGGRAKPPPVPTARPVVPPVQPAPACKAAPAAASAGAINRWAKPRTLRSQFILTEVLKPPLSMREPRGGSF